MKLNNRLKSRMKKLNGTIRSKGKNGNLYYRLTIASGVRKEFPLKTKDEAEAIQKAEELDAIWAAPTVEVAAAQINAIKGFSKIKTNLDFATAYQKYLEQDPDVLDLLGLIATRAAAISKLEYAGVDIIKEQKRQVVK